VYDQIFSSDATKVSLFTLRDLELMFRNPDRGDEVAIYLYVELTRGASEQDHSLFNSMVDNLIKRHPQQPYSFYQLQLTALMGDGSSLVSIW